MTDSNPSKKQLEELSKQIRQDQSKDAPAEKRVKVKTTFGKAIRKMAQTQPPKKENQKKSEV